MEARAFSLQTGQVVGAAVAAVSVGALLLMFLWLKRRRREARNERAPQREKVLRPAGYSSLCRIDELHEQLLSGLAQAVASAVLFGLTGGMLYPIATGLALGEFTLAQLWALPRYEVLIAVLAFALGTLLWCVRSLARVWKLEDEARNWRFGLRGEQAVAEKLGAREVAAAGYVAFHDVPGDGKWNIDHIVVGPGGVFVLETKARPRRRATRAQEEQDVVFDGQVLQFPWCEDWKAVRQVAANARWVREFLAGFGPKEVPVQPVIVVPGWYVKPKGNYPVKVMNAKYLVGYLARMKPLFTHEQLVPLVRRLDERCRDLEF